jgi:uncharacterized protein DUF4349
MASISGKSLGRKIERFGDSSDRVWRSAMTLRSEVSTANGWGKRILRFFFLAVGGILTLFVLILVSSRMDTDAVFRGIEAERATGLSGYMLGFARQSGTLAQSGDDPQIVRAASLALGTRDFDGARSGMEAVVRSHRGHFDQLQVGALRDSGRTLEANLRVPVEEFDSALAQLKELGSAEQESQTSVESSAESDRLDTKLAAAQFKENRLNQLLREHTGTLGEYLEVEQEIAKVHTEVEDLEAQRERQTQRVRYGAVQISLAEEHVAHFNIELAAISARLRASVVDGLQGVVRQGSAALSLVLLFAPSLMFWVLLLYWPARFGWRRVRASLTTRNAPTAAH